MSFQTVPRGKYWTAYVSDHKATKCSTLLHSPKRKDERFTNVLDWSNADGVSTIEFLENCYSAFLNDYQNDTVRADDLWLSFKNIVQNCLTSFVPVRKKRVHKKNPWITRDIIHMKRRVTRLRKAKNKSDESHLTELIRKLSHSLKANIRAAKDRYLNVTLNNFIKTAPHKF